MAPHCGHITRPNGLLPNKMPQHLRPLGRPRHMENALNIRLTGLLLGAILVVPLATISNARASAQSGVASVYSTESGSRTASGARLNLVALTAAHRSLPFGSKVRVTNRSDGRSVLVTVNDRGPFVRERWPTRLKASRRAAAQSRRRQPRIQRQFRRLAAGSLRRLGGGQGAPPGRERKRWPTRLKRRRCSRPTAGHSHSAPIPTARCGFARRLG